MQISKGNVGDIITILRIITYKLTTERTITIRLLNFISIVLVANRICQMRNN